MPAPKPLCRFLGALAVVVMAASPDASRAQTAVLANVAPDATGRSAATVAPPTDVWDVTTRSTAAMPGEPPEPALPVDGIVVTPEPTPVIDGNIAPPPDALSTEDAQAFGMPASPPPGYDPSIFSLEVAPSLDRRPTQFHRFEPYAPVGIKLGSFVLFPETEMTGAWSNNQLSASGNPQAGSALEVRPSIRAVSVWSTHALELGAKGLASYHDRFPSEDDKAYTLEARGRLDIRRRTNLEAAVSRDVSQEARGTAVSSSGAAGRADIVTDQAALTLNHRFNRLSVQLRGTIRDIDYAAPSVGGIGAGAVPSVDDRDQHQRAVAGRATWSFNPRLAVFGEVELGDRHYDAAPISDGISRNARTERVSAGVSFGNTSQILRGELSLGQARQNFDDARLPTISGIVLDANLAWRATGLTSVLFNASSAFTDSTLAGSGGVLSRTAGVEVRHAFRRHLIGTAGLATARSDYAGIDLVERETTAKMGLEYHVSRELMLLARYQHVAFDTNSLTGDYSADEVRLGVRLRR